MVRQFQEFENFMAVLALELALVQYLLHALVQLSNDWVENFAVNTLILSAELVLETGETELGLAILALSWFYHQQFADLTA